MIRRQIAMEMGLLVPAIRIRDNMQLPPNYYSVKLKGTEIGGGELNPDMFLAMDPGTVSQTISGIETTEPAFNMPALWIEEARREDAELKGYTVVDSSSVVATHLTELIKRHAAEILGRQEVHELVDKTKEHFPAVVEACVQEGNTGRLGLIQKVAQNLLREGVSIRNFPTILEAIADYADHARDINNLTELVRQSLARQLTSEFADANRILRVLTLEPSFENKMVEAVQKTNSIHRALSPSELQSLYQVLNQKVEYMIIQGFPPLVMCSPVIRPYFREMISRAVPQLSVLSYNEIVLDVQIENVDVIRPDMEG
jgi:flagellar biosynthesis protein FlhA